MSNSFGDENSNSSNSSQDTNDQIQAIANVRTSNASNSQAVDNTRSSHQVEDIRFYGELIPPDQTIEELVVFPDRQGNPQTSLTETDGDDRTSTESSGVSDGTDIDFSDTSSLFSDYNVTNDESANETESSDDQVDESDNEGRMNMRTVNVPHDVGEDEESIEFIYQIEDNSSVHSDVTQQGPIQSPTITSNVNDPTLYETIDLTESDNEGAVSPVIIDLTQDSDQEEPQRNELNLNTHHSGNDNEHLGQGHNGSDTENVSNTRAMPDMSAIIPRAFDTNPITTLLSGQTVDTVEHNARIPSVNSSIRGDKRSISVDNNRQDDNQCIPGAIKRFRTSMP